MSGKQRLTMTLLILWPAAALAAPSGAGTVTGGTAVSPAPDAPIIRVWNDPTPAADQWSPSSDPRSWPNRYSRANSDDWLVEHGDHLRQMQPRLLVLNFVDGLSSQDAVKKVDALIAAVDEGSRYHGYKDSHAPAFLDYHIDRLVDLTDPAGTTTIDGNCAHYPRLSGSSGGINFDYARLFTSEFAAYYGYPDPKVPGRFLTLSDLVNRGVIHEVWFLAKQGGVGAPFECTEVKQAYDAGLHKLPGQWKQAGNGADPRQPFIGRSLRILFVNTDRGPGCALESLSHGMEGTAHSEAIPYFSRYFNEYASFDLDQRFHLPFSSFYGRNGAEMDYPNPHTLVVRREDGSSIVVQNYYVIGGNVHFTPTARRDYDLDNPETVMSTIEGYRLGGGPGGADLARPWSDAVFKRYDGVAADCQGPWLVYWRQNMPGYLNRARDAQGQPMKNWWVFLFY